jgi:hypothetical protein
MTTSTVHEFDPTPTFHQSLQGLIARADADNVPTGMLVTLASAPFGKGILRDGLAFIDTVDQRQWEAIYGTLAQSRLTHASLSFKPLDIPLVAAPESEEVSIGLLNVRYQQPSRRLMSRILRAQRDDAEIGVPDGTLVEERVAFVASALLPPSYWGFERQPDVYAGLDVRFHLDPAWVVSNAGNADRIEIDFDDGNGFHELAVGGKHSVRYDIGGERRVVLRAKYGAESRTAAFLFRAEPTTVPNPDDVFVVRESIPHRGRKHVCRVAVFLGAGNAKITRPFILAEGFPGGTKLADLYDRINGKAGERFNPDAKLADTLRREGFDLLLMFFETGGAELQGNAYAYLAALQEIWKRMGEKGEIIATGGSMGGLIARYALAYAETNNVQTGNVTALITFDSPHLGANVPIGVQCVARYFAHHRPADAGDVIKLLDLPAAKQMLVVQRWTADQDEHWRKDDFIQFYAELGRLGVGGYPSKIKKYAVSNGAGDGASGIQPLKRAVLWKLDPGGVFASAEAIGAPNGTEGIVAHCFLPFYNWFYHSKGYYSRDGVSGGTAEFFGQMADAFRRQKGTVDEQVRAACFVPAHSALGYPVENAYAFKADSLKPGDVPFTAWYVSRTNDAHATVDRSIKEWVMNLLLRSTAEKRFYLSGNGRSLGGNFDHEPYRLEMLRPGVRGVVSLELPAGEDGAAAQTCLMKVTHGGVVWYVSPKRVPRPQSGDVLKLVRSPDEAVRLIPVFNEGDKTVKFLAPEQPPGFALTLDTRGYAIKFQPLQQRNEPPIIQHFTFEPAPGKEMEKAD